jgi:hypothetical protein
MRMRMVKNVMKMETYYLKINMENVKAHLVFVFLQSEYFNSDVTSGEFIHSVKMPKKLLGNDLSEDDIKQGIQLFLNWDESPETFDVIKIGEVWYTTEHIHNDWVVFQGKRYPVRDLTVEHCEYGDPVTYTVAPESLLDEMNKVDDINQGLSLINLDSEIYHYVDDAVWHLTGKEICEQHLDMPFVFIEEN